MAGAGIPHLAFPPRIGGDNHFQVVQQDSEDDILACVYVALKTPLGTRYYVPNFGVDDHTFESPVRVADIQEQVQASEPRATLDLSTQIQDLIEDITVGVSNVG